LIYQTKNLSLRQAVELICELTGIPAAQAEAEIAAAGRDGAFQARAGKAVEHDGFLQWPLPTIVDTAYVPARFWGFAIHWQANDLVRGHEWAEGVTIPRAAIERIWGPAAAPAAKGGAAVAPAKRGPRPALAARIEQRMLDDLKSGHVGREELAGWTEEALKAEYGASRDTCRKARKAALSKFVGVSATANADQ
jgi:hypothetical protein